MVIDGETLARASEAPCRSECDSLGEVAVPADALYGAQTRRAVENFDLSAQRLCDFPALVAALGMVKLAALRANVASGIIPETIEAPIQAACLEVMSGQLDHAFPVAMLQGGAGTSTNMNANEVIANRAAQLIGAELGQYRVVHPNDHVNASQSTNDVYPTAARIAVIKSAANLEAALSSLSEAFLAKGRAFSGIPKLARTQLQDAVPMTLGREFTAFGVTLAEDVARLREATTLLLEVNLGGTAVGTGVNAPAAYAEAVIPALAGISGLPLIRAADLVEASWDLGAFVTVSGALKRTAVKLSKISNDLRLLSSGPAGGIGEIRLPARQPGSSIMPGKINPVIPEVVTQAAYQVIGADVAVTMAVEAGQLQLNAMEPVVVLNVLQSIDLLTRAARALDRRCVQGIEAVPERCLRNLTDSTAVATLAAPLIGYNRAAVLAKRSLATGVSMSRLIVEEGLLGEDALRALLTQAGAEAPIPFRPLASLAEASEGD
ncbi:MAG: aspartate ammonia-lyase [Brevundimonas sp.]|nr:aspartate ammonia-lyase [Brevundimonas sp.]MDZ4060711.1 aspartate ammonia-lyase [Brevundimonas sp.]